MKKKLSIALILSILIVTLFSVNAFAYDTKTEALLDKLTTSDEIAVTIPAGDTFLGSSSDTFYIKGNTVAFEYHTGFLTVKAVLKDGVAYAYFPSLPFFYAKIENMGLDNIDVLTILGNASQLTQAVTAFEKSSFEEAVDGKTYYVEQFTDRATTTLKFYYDGDDLKILSVHDETSNSTQNTYFEKISFSVSDKDVAVPRGLDVTPIFNYLFSSLIGSIAG